METALRQELLEKFQQGGELLLIWQCEKCDRIVPFYKSNPFIEMIYLCWAHDHKFCPECLQGKKRNREENENNRINELLQKYEPIEENDRYVEI